MSATQHITLLAANTTAKVHPPVFIDSRGTAGGEGLISRTKAALRVLRAGSTGTVAIHGADLKLADQGDDAQVFEGDGVTTVFDTDLTYAAFSNYNWIVLTGPKGSPTVHEHAAGAGNAQVSDNGGKARVTFGTAPAAGVRIEVHFVAPVEILAAGAHQFEDTTIDTRDLVWCTLASTPSATTVTVSRLAAAC